MRSENKVEYHFQRVHPVRPTLAHQRKEKKKKEKYETTPLFSSKRRLNYVCNKGTNWWILCLVKLPAVNFIRYPEVLVSEHASTTNAQNNLIIHETSNRRSWRSLVIISVTYFWDSIIGNRATISSQYISSSSYAAIIFSSLTTCSTWDAESKTKQLNVHVSRCNAKNHSICPKPWKNLKKNTKFNWYNLILNLQLKNNNNNSILNSGPKANQVYVSYNKKGYWNVCLYLSLGSLFLTFPKESKYEKGYLGRLPLVRTENYQNSELETLNNPLITRTS